MSEGSKKRPKLVGQSKKAQGDRMEDSVRNIFVQYEWNRWNPIEGDIILQLLYMYR